MKQGTIIEISGPLVKASGMQDASVREVALVGNLKLSGEILEMHGDVAFIQVYEETSGLKPGEPVIPTGEPLSVELGPGLLTKMFDGLQRPLEAIRDQSGTAFIERGLIVDQLDRSSVWTFNPTKSVGDEVSEGDIVGTVQEGKIIEHKIMVPIGVSGKITAIESGDFTIADTVYKIETETGEREFTMVQKWPVRNARPVKEKLSPKRIMRTGQRVIDTLFPITKGGTAAVPGPFGAGKTVVQHQIAKHADADVVVYVGCGERGNEMTEVINEFPQLTDPETGESIMERTVLIANTSNMPVAAREASIYTGITIAEYFRDMGYSVAIMADSTSRWAEALRELSGRLEEMPGDEGYPAYLGSRIADFYERAGLVVPVGDGEREGAVSVIGAVSPPGGDTSEPVTQNTLRVVRIFWSLSASLSQQGHYPAINWNDSYSQYSDDVTAIISEERGIDWTGMVRRFRQILNAENGLQEIISLVGPESLSDDDRITLLIAKMIREDFLQQNAYDDVDTKTSADMQVQMVTNILYFEDQAREALTQGISYDTIAENTHEVRTRMSKAKFITEEESKEALDAMYEDIRTQIFSEVSEGSKA